MPRDASHDVQIILDSIRSLVEALRASTRESERKFGISAAQLYVLQKLSEEPSRTLSLNDLAERTLTHQSSVSVVVSRLEEKGLLERRKSRADARRVEIGLTPRGKSILRRAPGTVQERLLRAIEAFSEKEARTLSGLLSQLIAQAGMKGKTVPLFFEGDKT